MRRAILGFYSFALVSLTSEAMPETSALVETDAVESRTVPATLVAYGKIEPIRIASAVLLFRERG